ncbi:PIG-L deacetylase family protein [Catenuloplanes japonicus]|uniref:PIG-L deacetylase family protein n=1 Tax=Catenuloplanes japonicus TaxID=33876 RepID=UPI000525864D|nr:PIG-L family deacetylase [Catenuloplanes japonicus]
MRPYTVVAFHAHPDDEALLTGGTLARAAAEGHRVVLVTATLGEAGLAAALPTAGGLGGQRRDELMASAAALGCARVEVLGYRDSGMEAADALDAGVAGILDDAGSIGARIAGSPETGGSGRNTAHAMIPGRADDRIGSAEAARTSSGNGARPGRFADAPVAEVAARLAALLREEDADVLIGYDARGGYGHPDHLQVHRVASAAARIAGTPVLLEATVDRRALRPLLAVLRLAGRLMPRLPLGGAETAFTPHEELTHAVDVRGHLRQKRAALRAHASQTTGGRGLRTVAALAALPGPLFAAVAGREWFTEPGSARDSPLSDDIFRSLRG